MTIVIVIISGLVGTALMTLFMYGMTFLTNRVMKVTKILGTLLTAQTSARGQLSNSRRAIVLGIMAHYLIGIGFALAYYGLWKLGIGRPDLVSGVWFGLGSGAAAIAFWYTFLALHPKPPAIPLRSYLFTLFLAHIVFTYGVIITYRLLAGANSPTAGW